MSRRILYALLVGCALMIVGCSSGGGGGGGGEVTAPTTGISGIVAEGIYSFGTVNIYALDNAGNTGALLGTSSIESDGTFSASLPYTTGPLLVEATGVYLDEATGNPIARTIPLRAALNCTGSDVAVAVTPLTEMAVQKAGTLTAVNIDDANALISSVFKIPCLSTLPVLAFADEMTAGTQDQRDYAVMLAVLSQMAADLRTTEDDIISAFVNDIATNGTILTTLTDYQNAMATFLDTANPFNHTGEVVGSTNAGAIGGQQAITTLVLSGTSPANIGDVVVDIILPTTATARIRFPGWNVSTDTGGIINSAFSPGIFTADIQSDTGFGPGTILVLVTDIEPGTTVTPDDFTLENLSMVDTAGNPITGLTATLSTVIR